MVVTEEVKESTSFLHDQPRASSRINDNYCVTKLQARLLAGSPSTEKTIDTLLNVKYHVAPSVHSAPGHSQKKEISPGSAGCYVKENRLKYVESVSCVTRSIVLCITCNKCQKCCLKSTCRGQTPNQANLAGSGCRSESCSNPERGLHPPLYPPLSDPTKTHKVSHSRKLLCQSSQEQLPVRGITSAYRQKCSGTSSQQNFSELFQSTVLSSQTEQQMETHTGFEQSKSLPQGGEIQNGDTGNHQDIPPTRRVGHLNRFQGCLYFHIPIQEQSRKYLRFHVQGQTYQFKALPFGLSTAPLEFTVVRKEVKLMAIHKGIRIHQYRDDWLEQHLTRFVSNTLKIW